MKGDKAMMLRAECDLTGVAPLSFSKATASEKTTGESSASHEERCWRERLHVDEDGIVFIPPMAIKWCLADAAQFLSESIPGAGKAKFTKHFKAGAMVVDAPSLGIKASDVVGERLFVPSDGRRGGGKRVWKIFPTIPAGWQAHVIVYLQDPVLIEHKSKVEEYLIHAGQFIGIGRFRPINGGFYGRFRVSNFEVFEQG